MDIDIEEEKMSRLPVDYPYDLTAAQVEQFDLKVYSYFFHPTEAQRVGLDYVYYGNRKGA